ncbi:MAG: Type 1 glutamine amidotransferase-like domain-containing protein, partial [Myxococcales bacterium]
MKRLLLISNSTQWGRGYLDHVEAEIRAFLGDACRVGFVPFALFDRDAYTAKVRARFQPMGFDLRTVADGFGDCDAIFVGGGNTFRLLKALQDRDLVEPIRRRVLAGMPYVGSSAGSIVAGPSLKT